MAEQEVRIDIDEDEVWLVRFQRGTHALTFKLLKEENYRGEENVVERGEGRLTWEGKLVMRFTEEIEFEMPTKKRPLPLTTVVHTIFNLGPQHITNWDPKYGNEEA